MALINCPRCGRPVSDKATQCPNCGTILYPLPLKVSYNQNINDTSGVAAVVNKSRRGGASKTCICIGSVIFLLCSLFDLFLLSSCSYDLLFLFVSTLGALSTPLILFGLFGYGPASGLRNAVGVGVGIILLLRFGSRIVALILYLLSLPDSVIQSEFMDLSILCYRFSVSYIISILSCVVFGVAAIVMAVNLRKSLLSFPTMLFALIWVLDLVTNVAGGYLDREMITTYYGYIYPALSVIMAIAYLILAQTEQEKLRPNS